MTDNDTGGHETTRKVIVAVEPPTADSLLAPPLVLFDGDDDLVCVDDTCLPARMPE